MNRIIATIHNGPHFVKVYWNSEQQEYACRLDNKPRTDYFTTEKSDALGTADAMLKAAVAKDAKQSNVGPNGPLCRKCGGAIMMCGCVYANGDEA